LVLPDVRHRTPCELLVAVEGAAERRTLVLYPASLLKGAAGRLRERRIGVLDSRGTVQRALRAEGVAYEDLGPQVARDWFDGDLVILAGGPDRDALAEACRAFDTRVRGGMGMVILNPPAGWSAWGLRRVERAPPAAGPLRVWPEARAGLVAEDLGVGPWAAVLDGPADVVPLVWCELAVTARVGAGLPGGAPAALVAARPVGAGWVLVSALPQTEFPDVDAVGRGVLAEMMLWLVQPPAAAQAKENAHE
jgi:hypothetical protein